MGSGTQQTQFLKDYFHGYMTEHAYLTEMLYTLDTMQKQSESVRAQQYYSYNRTSSADHDSMLSSTITKMDDLKGKIKAQQKKLNRMRRNHLKDIAQISNIQGQCIIRMCYLDGKPVEEIADFLQCSIDHVYKLKRQAACELYRIITQEKEKTSG